MLNKALFLDRDGVINVEENYLYKIADFKFKDGIFEVLRHFQSLKFLLVIITNQSGIARGYYTEKDFWTLTEWMVGQFLAQGIVITKVYFSPYHPEYGLGKYKKDSNCRKPNPGMILQAQRELNLDLTASILVGDQETDIEAGINSGIKRNILVNEHPLTKPTKAMTVVNSVRDLLLIEP
ncbi:MAG TPA: HAD family hydrolase [Bacillota bacterium]|nr:HAD family hydrolase [Bacillota bacterium]